MRALNPSGWDMQTQIWPHWLLTNRAPHGGRHALLACSAEAAAALFAMDKLLTRRPDNYPDTGGPSKRLARRRNWRCDKSRLCAKRSSERIPINSTSA